MNAKAEAREGTLAQQIVNGVEIRVGTDLTKFNEPDLRAWLEVNRDWERTSEGYLPWQVAAAYITGLQLASRRGQRITSAIVEQDRDFVYEK